MPPQRDDVGLAIRVRCQILAPVLHLRRMGKTVTIRLTKELADWLEQASKQSGVPKGRIVREQLEKARDGGKQPSFMRLAGSIRANRALSARKGFSLKEHLVQLARMAVRFLDQKPDLADLCLVRMSELFPRHSVITIDRKDFQIYRRNKREAIPLLCPPERR